MAWNHIQPPCNTCVHYAQRSQDNRNHQGPTLPHAAYLHPQVAVLRQLLSVFPVDVAIGRAADINKKTVARLLISETDVRTVGFDLLSSGNGRILHKHNVVCLHKPIRLMPVPSTRHWNPIIATNVPVDDGGYLIVSISVVRRCEGTTACHNVVDCLQACTALHTRQVGLTS